MKIRSLLPVVLVATLSLAQVARAVVITPSAQIYNDPNVPASVTYGGSGIPTGNSSSSVVAVNVDRASNVVLYTAVTARYANTPIGNSVNGVYTAFAGGDVLDGQPTYSTWNFDIASLVGANALTSVLLSLSWNFNDGAITTIAIPVNYQDSIPPHFLFGPSFDPNATGKYAFDFVAKDANGSVLTHVASVVNVVGVPDSASTALLLGLGLLGAAALRSKRSLARQGA